MNDGNIVHLDDHRPHVTGPARCSACLHEWQAVTPVGVVWLQCPQCGTMRGLLKFPHARPGVHWQCQCGELLFSITPTGTYCPRCGADQEFTTP